MIRVNINKAKSIGHEIRREERAKEFAPLDEIIMKQIPGNDYDEAERQRQAIREKYAVVQQLIDAATTPDEIKEALGVR
jgi:hypothetical protein